LRRVALRRLVQLQQERQPVRPEPRAARREQPSAAAQREPPVRGGQTGMLLARELEQAPVPVLNTTVWRRRPQAA